MIPQNRKKVKPRPCFVHIKKPKNRPFSRGFWSFTICSQDPFPAPENSTRVQENAQQRMQFEQKVKNPRLILNCLLFVQIIIQIVYILSPFNLLSSQIHHTFFAVSTPYVTMRSKDGHVHPAQFSGSIFYVCANCTNFFFCARFRLVWD